MEGLLLVMAVATTQLDNNSFVVRKDAEKCLTNCGIFAGAHIEAIRKSRPPLEVMRRADRIWLRMPNFYARFVAVRDGRFWWTDFNAAVSERCGYDDHWLTLEANLIYNELIKPR